VGYLFLLSVFMVICRFFDNNGFWILMIASLYQVNLGCKHVTGQFMIFLFVKILLWCIKNYFWKSYEWLKLLSVVFGKCWSFAALKNVEITTARFLFRSDNQLAFFASQDLDKLVAHKWWVWVFVCLLELEYNMARLYLREWTDSYHGTSSGERKRKLD